MENQLPTIMRAAQAGSSDDASVLRVRAVPLRLPRVDRSLEAPRRGPFANLRD